MIDRDPFDLSDAMAQWYENCFLGLQSRSFPHQQVGCNTYLVSNNTFRSFVGVGTIDFPVKELLPQSQCVVVQRLTNLAGRSGRGRGYLSNLPIDALDGGYLRQDLRQNLEDRLNSNLTPIVADGVTLTLALPSYVHAGLRPITEWRVNAKLGSLHRRAHVTNSEVVWNTPRRFPGT
jgi:hypothetical protein